MLPDSDIRNILVDRIDTQHQSVGIAVGAIGPQGRRLIAHGYPEKGDTRPVNGDTVFEIGSVTKVFTSLVLADMACRGEVALDDPAAKYLPQNVKMPEDNGRSITLVDLATHTSGLPKMPRNFVFNDPANPYADYSVEQLYQFLSGYQLTRGIGEQYEYSNLGVGLLGHMLAQRAGMDYETLVFSRICEPLGMNDTRVILSPEMEARRAVGHNHLLEPVASWDWPTLAGAGALRSTANDLLTFLAANLGYASTHLTPAMDAMRKVRRPTGQSRLVQRTLCGEVLTMSGKEIFMHGGGAGGCRAFMGFDPKARIGVAALSNAATAIGVDDIGRHLLDARLPLAKPTKARTQVTVDPKLFDCYTGRYEGPENKVIVITREGAHLFLQGPQQSDLRLEMFAEGERHYFLKQVNAQVTFIPDGHGRATALIFRHHAQDVYTRWAGDADATNP